MHFLALQNILTLSRDFTQALYGIQDIIICNNKYIPTLHDICTHEEHSWINDDNHSDIDEEHDDESCIRITHGFHDPVKASQGGKNPDSTTIITKNITF